MRKIILGLLLPLFLLPMVANATWQIGQASLYSSLSYKYVMIVKKDSLYSNVERFARRYGWKVIWANDSIKYYRVLINTKLSGRSVPYTMNLLLQNFDVKVYYNTKRKIIRIYPADYFPRFFKNKYIKAAYNTLSWIK